MDPLNFMEGHPRVPLTQVRSPWGYVDSAHQAVLVLLLKADMNVEK